MASAIAWLDASSEEQRRMRDIIRLFSDRESRDELGLGQIRDAIADALFPGTSTLLTRARYLLFVPWAYQLAASRPNPAAAADRFERDIIRALRDSDDYAGLLGMQAGEALKTLPSAVYWSMLRHYGILADPSLSREESIAIRGRGALSDDPTATQSGRPDAWSSTMPDPPDGFPQSIPGGFTLRYEEAAWLRDRLLGFAPETLLAHLVIDRPAPESPTPWADAAALRVSGTAREWLDDARSFSALMHGAQLLYNLMLAEQYESAGYDRLNAPSERFGAALEDWQSRFEGLVDLRSWDLAALLHRVDIVRGSPINPRTRQFVTAWRDLLADGGGQSIIEYGPAREFMAARERQHKGPQARLGNFGRLASWGGTAGAGAMTYRWSTVRGILLDIHAGLDSAPGDQDA